MQSDRNIHNGHRERLKDRFLREGLECFEEHNVLELLLFYAFSRKDTNETAHALLNRFGSLEGVFSADEEELKQVHEIGENTARFLKLISHEMKSYMKDRQQHDIIEGYHNITEFAVRNLAASEMECLIICFIDNKSCMLNWHFIQEGFVSPEFLDTKNVIRMMMGTNATHAILARNYRKKRASFTKKDFAIVRDISAALRTVGVGLFDYIVVGSDRTYKALSNTPEVEPYRIYLS